MFPDFAAAAAFVREHGVRMIGDDLRLGHLLGGDCQILAEAAGSGDPAGAAGRNDYRRRMIDLK